MRKIYRGRASAGSIEIEDSSYGNSHTYKIVLSEAQFSYGKVAMMGSEFGPDRRMEITIIGEYEMEELAQALRKFLEKSPVETELNENLIEEEVCND